MKIIGKIWLLGVAVLPCVIALSVDGKELDSYAHIPIIGITGIAITLSDALFGQIVSITRDMPFSNGGTPAQIERFARQFEKFNSRIFNSWLVTKIASALAILIPALILAAGEKGMSSGILAGLLCIGYLAVGTACSSILYFYATYKNSRKTVFEMHMRIQSAKYRATHSKRTKGEDKYITDCFEERFN